MNQLRQAAARERRVPMFWWTGMALLMGGGLYLLLRPHSPFFAGLLAFLLGVCVTVLCFRLRQMSREDDQNKESEGIHGAD